MQTTKTTKTFTFPGMTRHEAGFMIRGIPAIVRLIRGGLYIRYDNDATPGTFHVNARTNSSLDQAKYQLDRRREEYVRQNTRSTPKETPASTTTSSTGSYFSCLASPSPQKARTVNIQEEEEDEDERKVPPPSSSSKWASIVQNSAQLTEMTEPTVEGLSSLSEWPVLPKLMPNRVTELKKNLNPRDTDAIAWNKLSFSPDVPSEAVIPSSPPTTQAESPTTLVTPCSTFQFSSGGSWADYDDDE